MDLSIIIVHYKTPDLLAPLLESLLIERLPLSFEILVIDNGSDHSLARLVPSDARVVLHSLGNNSGFSKAANEGIRKSQGRYLLVTNGDVEFPPNSVHTMVERMDSLPGAGALGIRLKRPDGEEEVNGGSFPTILSEYRRRQLILDRKGKKARKGGIERKGLEERDWVSGACMLLRREAVEEAGHFDERFFVYYEDVDLCTRLLRGGWRVYYDPTVSVLHHGGASCRQVPELALQAYRDSQRYFWRKHHGLLGLGLLRAAVAAKELFTATP